MKKGFKIAIASVTALVLAGGLATSIVLNISMNKKVFVVNFFVFLRFYTTKTTFLEIYLVKNNINVDKCVQKSIIRLR